MRLPFFGEIEGLFLEIENINEKNKEIVVKLKLPKELEFLKDLILFEIKTIEKHRKKKIILKFD
jgi:hypothetical protein